MNANQTCCSVEKQPAVEKAGGVQFVPAVDIVETAHDFTVTADMPGAAADRIDVQYEDGELRIHAPVAPRQSADRRYLLQEYGVGDYRRSFRIGPDVDAAKIEARYADGVLTLKLPKVEAKKPRKVTVNVA
jgi:HSP20 family protein